MVVEKLSCLRLPSGLSQTPHLHSNQEGTPMLREASPPGCNSASPLTLRRAYFRLCWKPRCLWELRNSPRLAAEASPWQAAQARTGSVASACGAARDRGQDEGAEHADPRLPQCSSGPPWDCHSSGPSPGPGCWGRRLTESQAPVSLA